MDRDVEKDVMGIAGSMRISFAGERLVLLPDRAIYWEKRATLLVADVHLGKGAAFRAMGVPVPAGNSAKDLKRLSALLAATAVDHSWGFIPCEILAPAGACRRNGGMAGGTCGCSDSTGARQSRPHGGAAGSGMGDARGGSAA